MDNQRAGGKTRIGRHNRVTALCEAYSHLEECEYARREMEFDGFKKSREQNSKEIKVYFQYP